MIQNLSTYAPVVKKMFELELFIRFGALCTNGHLPKVILKISILDKIIVIFNQWGIYAGRLNVAKLQ